MRAREEIQADPQATEEEIRWLSWKDNVAALQHPNCPAPLWWRIAEVHPVEAMASVLYPLMLIESPERWAEQERDYRVLEKLIEHAEGKLTSDERSQMREDTTRWWDIECSSGHHKEGERKDRLQRWRWTRLQEIFQQEAPCDL